MKICEVCSKESSRLHMDLDPYSGELKTPRMCPDCYNKLNDGRYMLVGRTVYEVCPVQGASLYDDVCHECMQYGTGRCMWHPAMRKMIRKDRS